MATEKITSKTEQKSKPLAKNKKPPKKPQPKKEKKKEGRPLLLEIKPEIATKIVNAILGGNYLEVAAAYAGINKETLFRWLRLGGRTTEGIYYEFSNSIGQAMAQAEVNDVSVVNAAARGIKNPDGTYAVMPDWKASAWRLERRNQSRWGRKDQVQNTNVNLNTETKDKKAIDAMIDAIKMVRAVGHK